MLLVLLPKYYVSVPLLPLHMTKCGPSSKYYLMLYKYTYHYTYIDKAMFTVTKFIFVLNVFSFNEFYFAR